MSRTSCFVLFTGVFLLALSSASVRAAEIPLEERAYLQAVQLFNQHNWDQARRAFLAFQHAYPRSRWLTAVQLRLADLESDPQTACSAYAGVIGRIGDSEWAADARWGLANTLFTLGKYAEALPHLLEVHRSDDPRGLRALYLAGRCQMALENFPRARELFTQVLDQSTDGAVIGPALAGRGDAAATLRADADALADYDRYLRDYPDGELTDYVSEQRSKIKSPGSSAASPAADKTKTEAAESAGGFTIQVGAFTKEEYAAKLVKRLRAKGFNAYLMTSRTGGEIFHQVRVGNYANRQLAEALSSRLEKAEHLPVLILPYENARAERSRKAESGDK